MRDAFVRALLREMKQDPATWRRDGRGQDDQPEVRI